MEDTLLVHPTNQGLCEVFEKMPSTAQEAFIGLVEKDANENRESK